MLWMRGVGERFMLKNTAPNRETYRPMRTDAKEIVALSEAGSELIAAGTKRALWLRAHDELSGSVLLPGLIARGAGPGRTLVAVAGVHGDEYEGMDAIRRAFAELDPATMSGLFIGIPVANPFAYEARRRATPETLDGLNLARVFPGDPAGSPSRRLAAALLAFVERLVGPDDLFIDFHSGSADADYATVVGVRDAPRPATARSITAARAFGVHRLWLIPDSPGPFNAETARRGIPTIGTETTGRAGLLAADVAVYHQGLRNLLAHLGVTAAGPPRPIQSAFRGTIDIVSPVTGFFRTEKRLYDHLVSGDRIGTFVDLFGDSLGDVTAPASGELWSMRATPAVRVGELIGMIAVSDEGRNRG